MKYEKLKAKLYQMITRIRPCSEKTPVPVTMKSFLDGTTNVSFSYKLGNLQYATSNVFHGSKYAHIRNRFVTAERSESFSCQGAVLGVSSRFVLLAWFVLGLALA